MVTSTVRTDQSVINNKTFQDCDCRVITVTDPKLCSVSAPPGETLQAALAQNSSSKRFHSESI